MYQFSRKNGLRWTSQTDGRGGGRGGTARACAATGAATGGHDATIFGAGASSTTTTGAMAPVSAFHSSAEIDAAHRSTKSFIVTGSIRAETICSSAPRASRSASAWREYHK